MRELNNNGATYVDAPELLDTVEADDFLQELVPVLLWYMSVRSS